VRGPSPSCGVAGKKFVRGRRGVNKVRLNGRFGHHRLAPGTYEIVVVARRGHTRKRVGRISIQVVPPGSGVGRGSAPAFSCAASPVTQSGIPGAALFISPPSQNRSQNRSSPPAQSDPKSAKAPSRSGVLGAPPFHIGGGGTDWLLAILLYATLGLGGAVLLVHLVRYFRDPLRRYN
jgi:hypothetical protein